MSETELSWLVGNSLVGVEAEESGRWVFRFSGGGSLMVECPWRLLQQGLIAISSDDHKQQFGLPAPIDAAKEISACLAGKSVTAVQIATGTADLTIHFGADELQIIPFSSGYEAWETISPSGFQLIAQGGGQLAEFEH